MSLDKYQKAWKAEASQVQVTYDAELLSKEVKQSHDAVRSMILQRHVGVARGAILLIPIWCAMGYFWSMLWTWYLTVPVLLWIAGFMLVTLRRYPLSQIERGEPLLVCVKESLAQVEHQIWLMQSSFSWNLLPASVSLMVFNIHGTWERTQSWLGFILVSGGFGLFLFWIYRWSYRVSLIGVHKELGPRRDELQKLICNLESGGEIEYNSERLGPVSGLTEIVGCGGLSRVELSRARSQGAEKWNRIVPSWREVAWLVVPTLLSAYGASQYQLDFMKSMFFQSTLAACIAFAIAFFSLCFLSHRRFKTQPLSGMDDVRYNTLAVVTITLIVLMLILNFAAFLSLPHEIKSRKVKDSNDSNAPATDSRR